MTRIKALWQVLTGDDVFAEDAHAREKIRNIELRVEALEAEAVEAFRTIARDAEK